MILGWRYREIKTGELARMLQVSDGTVRMVLCREEFQKYRIPAYYNGREIFKFKNTKAFRRLLWNSLFDRTILKNRVKEHKYDFLDGRYDKLQTCFPVYVAPFAQRGFLHFPFLSPTDPQLSWSERPTHNRQVTGSSPVGSTIAEKCTGLHIGFIPRRQWVRLPPPQNITTIAESGFEQFVICRL